MTEQSPVTPAPRSGVAELPGYVAGKAATSAPGRASFKLSSNENPNTPLPSVVEVVARAASSMNRYPDPECRQLLGALSARYGLPTDWFAFGTGSVAVARQIIQAFVGPGDEVVYPWRSFEAYPNIVGLAGGRGVAVPLLADGRHDLPAMADAVTDATKVVLLCSPNNPTGPAIGRAELDELLDRIPTSVVVILDEAYQEYVRRPDAANGRDYLESHSNVCSLRTFSKAYGLAGLRVGYSVAPPAITAPIRRTGIVFGVSTIAEQAAVASLAAEAELFERVEATVLERGRVLAAARALGWPVPDAEGNFIWLELGELQDAFVAACDDAGVAVRPLGADGVRVSIGEVEANDLMLEVLGALRR